MPSAPEDRSRAPARTPAYCVGRDYGTPEDPKILLQVNAHRRHAKTPRCHEPPMIQRPSGEWVQAEDAPRMATQLRAARAAHETPESPAIEESPSTPPPPPDDPGPFATPFAVPGAEPPPLPLMHPRMVSGQATIPAPPKATAPETGPLFAQKEQLRFAPDIYELYSWLVQIGFVGSFEQALEQGFRTYMVLRWRKAIGVVDVDDAMLARAMGWEALQAA